MRNDAYFNRFWYEGDAPPLWTRLVSVLFLSVVFVRRSLYRIGILRQAHLPVPVIVIGNLVAGGVGKTPLTIALIEALQAQGFSPGVISRGYGGRPGRRPVFVDATTSPDRAGDEPVMIAVRTGVPVCVHPRRVLAGRVLLAAAPVDVIICDDGLQHYALARDIEVAVIDSERGLGNRQLLPAGPLRERPSRLARVDAIVINGNGTFSLDAAHSGLRSVQSRMNLVPSALVNLVTGERCAPDALAGQPCSAVAGIGNPQRFFTTLGELGYRARCRAFPDHHEFNAAELAFANGQPLLMTEKDAVKCRTFASPDWWYLEVSGVTDPSLVNGIVQRLRHLSKTAGENQ